MDFVYLNVMLTVPFLSRLQSIQRKLDRSMFDRETGNSEFKVGRLKRHLKRKII